MAVNISRNNLDSEANTTVVEKLEITDFFSFVVSPLPAVFQHVLCWLLQLQAVYFPPKKFLGNWSENVAAERRIQLQVCSTSSFFIVLFCLNFDAMLGQLKLTITLTLRVQAYLKLVLDLLQRIPSSPLHNAERISREQLHRLHPFFVRGIFDDHRR